MNRSQCYFTQGKYQLAIEDLEFGLTVESEENNPQVLYRLGLAYYSFEKNKRCIRILKKALKAGPFLTYLSDIYYHIGLAYCNLERFEQSIFPFSKSIKLIPSDVRYIHERAKAYQMINEHQLAIDDFEAVIQKCPRNSHAFFRRAFSQKALKFYDEAAEDFEMAKELDPLNHKLVVNYKKLNGINCIVLCQPGQEPSFV